jgi:hypothetical protein
MGSRVVATFVEPEGLGSSHRAVYVVTINKDVAREKRSWVQRTNKNTAHAVLEGLQANNH